LELVSEFLRFAKVVVLGFKSIFLGALILVATNHKYFWSFINNGDSNFLENRGEVD